MQTTHWIHAFDVAFEVKSAHEDPEKVLSLDIDAVADAMIARANYLRSRPQEIMEARPTGGGAVRCRGQPRMSAPASGREAWESLTIEAAASIRTPILEAGYSSAIATRALELLDQVTGRPDVCGDSAVVDGVWLETHTIGCRAAADEA